MLYDHRRKAVAAATIENAIIWFVAGNANVAGSLIRLSALTENPMRMSAFQSTQPAPRPAGKVSYPSEEVGAFG
jgi:hypothetical protein